LGHFFWVVWSYIEDNKKMLKPYQEYAGKVLQNSQKQIPKIKNELNCEGVMRILNHDEELAP